MKPRTLPPRDSRGRFIKAKPKPALLSPELVRSLGAHRRAVELSKDDWTIEVIEQRYYTTPGGSDELDA